jgi:SAM-dependent methyltransferase
VREQAYADLRQLEGSHWWYRGTREVYSVLLERFARRAEAGFVLDLGCGSGSNAPLLSRWGDLVGLDPWYAALRVLADRGLSVVQGVAGAIPFPDDTFEIVAMLGVLEHVHDDVAALAEAGRVCRPGGTILLLTSAFTFLWSGHDIANQHRRRYTAHQLHARARRAGLTVRYLSYQNALLFGPAVLVRLLQRLIPSSGPPRVDMFPMPEPINTLLASLLMLEGQLMRWLHFPFGVSLVAVLEAP